MICWNRERNGNTNLFFWKKGRRDGETSWKDVGKYQKKLIVVACYMQWGLDFQWKSKFERKGQGINVDNVGRKPPNRGATACMTFQKRTWSIVFLRGPDKIWLDIFCFGIQNWRIDLKWMRFGSCAGLPISTVLALWSPTTSWRESWRNGTAGPIFRLCFIEAFQVSLFKRDGLWPTYSTYFYTFFILENLVCIQKCEYTIIIIHMFTQLFSNNNKLKSTNTTLDQRLHFSSSTQQLLFGYCTVFWATTSGAVLLFTLYEDQTNTAMHLESF